MDTPDIPKLNDEIARKFQRIESELATCRSERELFETLLVGIERAFHLPFVWFSIIHNPAGTGLLERLKASDILRDRLNVIDQALFEEVIPDITLPLLASGDLKPFFRLLPPARKYFIRSLAVSPLTLHGRLIGSLNHGDASPTRYEPGMDTALLSHLILYISSRLDDLLPDG